MNNFFITTAIPYINANAHIGHAQEFLLADTISRILKAQGHIVSLQSGTDDNSLKNVLAAKDSNQNIQKYVEEKGEQFKALLKKLNIHPEYFIQTSSPEHHRGVIKFIQSLNQTDLYEGEYRGLYCVGCEDFLKADELNNGLCFDHKKEPQAICESNVFFKLSKYQQQIHDLIKNDVVKIYPISKKNEILKFIENGLQDISISRPGKGEGLFGVPFPGKKDQTVYVWIDALINYITGLGYGSFNDWSKVWNKDTYKIHVIGKNVWKFHAIYWIGLLLSAEIELPNELIIHGFLTNNGEKISKTLGNAINPLDILVDYDSDILRSYLLGKLNFELDSDFSQKNLNTFYTEELLNQIGNLYPRILTLCQKSGIQFNRNTNFVNFNNYDIKELFNNTLTLAQSLNKEINDSLIWSKPDSLEKTKTLEKWVQNLNKLSDNLEVLLPNRSILINRIFNERQKILLFEKKTKPT
jgi:methionyl-tRNA synthetase